MRSKEQRRDDYYRSTLNKIRCPNRNCPTNDAKDGSKIGAWIYGKFNDDGYDISACGDSAEQKHTGWIVFCNCCRWCTGERTSMNKAIEYIRVDLVLHGVGDDE